MDTVKPQDSTMRLTDIETTHEMNPGACYMKMALWVSCYDKQKQVLRVKTNNIQLGTQ